MMNEYIIGSLMLFAAVIILKWMIIHL